MDTYSNLPQFRAAYRPDINNQNQDFQGNIPGEDNRHLQEN